MKLFKFLVRLLLLRGGSNFTKQDVISEMDDKYSSIRIEQDWNTLTEYEYSFGVSMLN